MDNRSSDNFNHQQYNEVQPPDWPPPPKKRPPVSNFHPIIPLQYPFRYIDGSKSCQLVSILLSLQICCYIGQIIMPNSPIYSVLNALRIFSMLPTTVIYLYWVYITYSNLLSFGYLHLNQSSPGWAIANYLIPIQSLVKPYYALIEIWTRSNPKNYPIDSSTYHPEGSPLILGWWLLFTTYNILRCLYGILLFLRTNTIHRTAFEVAIDNSMFTLGILVCFFGIRLLKAITDRQAAIKTIIEQDIKSFTGI